MNKIKTIIKSYRFSIILLSGVVIGAFLGFIMGPKAEILQPIADIFLNLVFCLIVPVILISIMASIGSMRNIQKLKKILLTFLAIVIIGGLFTSFLALIVGFTFNPAQGVQLNLGSSTKNIKSSFDIVSMLTVSDFPKLLSIKNMLPLIIFTIIMGISLSLIGEKGYPAVKVLNSLSEMLSKAVQIVMYLAPLGIACYFASLIGKMGGQIVASIARLSIIYVVFCIFFFLLYAFTVTFAAGGRDGIRNYFQNVWTPLATGMGTCSSTAAIPANIAACKRMSIPREISDVLIPLGSSVHKNGVVSVQIFKILFLLGAFHLSIGGLEIFKAILVAVISGVIVGTIPSGGFIGEMFICTAFGLPLQAVPIIVIMGTLTDPFCTMVSVSSQSAMCMLVARFTEGKNWIKSHHPTEEIGSV